MHSEQAAPDLLQKSLDASGVGWWQLDFGQREMTCSRLAADLFGADRTRISFEEVYLLPGEEHRARIYTRCAALKVSDSLDETFVTANGDRCLQVRAVAAGNDQRTGVRSVFGTVRRVTESTPENAELASISQSYKATQRNYSHLAQLIEHLPIGYLRVNILRDNSGEAIDWVGDRLAERNIELWHESGDKNDETRYKHFAIGHSPKLPIDPKTGKFKITLAQVVEQYAAKKGARFDYNTKMVKLEKKNGRVTGVIAENADGKYVRYNAAKGVVVATGGYAQNWKMMEALQPRNLRIIGRSGALPGARGDGIRPDQQPGPDTVKSGDSGFFWIVSQPWLKVNADGRRFMNESGTYENILHADEYQKGHCHYTIFDSNWLKLPCLKTEDSL